MAADQAQLLDPGPSHITVSEGKGMVAGYYCVDMWAGEELWQPKDPLTRLAVSGMAGLVVSKTDALARARQLSVKYGVPVKLV